MSKKAMELALEALEKYQNQQCNEDLEYAGYAGERAIVALKEALGHEEATKQQGDPVGWVLAKRYFCTKCGGGFTTQKHAGCDYLALDMQATVST